MKKYFIFFLIYFIFSNKLLFSQSSFKDIPDTDGLSKVTAYQIWNKEHLSELSDSLYEDAFRTDCWHWEKHFILMQDIDFITREECLGLFNGYFHGNGKKITLVDTDGWAFFSMLYGTIDSLNVDGYVNGGAGIVASVMGSSYYIKKSGVVINCVNNATIYTNGAIDNITGKLVGLSAGVAYYNYYGGTISNCINNGDITGVDNVGGIAGENSGTIINCINTGKITATNSGSQPNGAGGVGGIVAYGSVSNCINLGSVVGQNNVGGIVGLGVQSIVSNCINYGFINGIGKVGGICGSSSHIIFSGVSISNSVNVGVVEGEEDIGSIVGKE